MREFSVVFRSVQDIQSFVSLAMIQPFRILVGNSSQRISGKSFMGMFSLDYSRPLMVYADCDDAQLQLFRQALTQLQIS